MGKWKSAYRLLPRRRLLKKPPTLHAMIRLIAQLGGQGNRKQNDDPGPQIAGLGLQRIHDIAQCWLRFDSGSREDGYCNEGLRPWRHTRDPLGRLLRARTHRFLLKTLAEGRH